jgi:hypothetical protein
VVTLYGSTGIGKTQLAFSYQGRHEAKYSAVFWIDASTNASVRMGFIHAARQIISQYTSIGIFAGIDLERDHEGTIEAVKSWLGVSTNTTWLMIFDNYQSVPLFETTRGDMVDIRQSIPPCDHGSIIITTRSTQVSLGTRISVRKLSDIQERMAILSSTSGRNFMEEGKYTILP